MRMPGEHAVCPHERGSVHQCVRVQVQPHQWASRAIIPPAKAFHACCRHSWTAAVHYLRLPPPSMFCFIFTLFNLYTTNPSLAYSLLVWNHHLVIVFFWRVRNMGRSKFKTPYLHCLVFVYTVSRNYVLFLRFSSLRPMDSIAVQLYYYELVSKAFCTHAGDNLLRRNTNWQTA